MAGFPVTPSIRSLSTENGQRQAVLMINHDPDTLAKPARLHLQLLVDRLIAKARTAPARRRSQAR